ncbi:MAG: DUF4239 domain-containing protein [Proteobacteria bacterium]|nr:DUF4239 domain-containing protein [Pseudomonadota bacterium]
MLSLGENILIGFVVMAGALLFMALVNRLWPARDRYAQEDLIGWQLNILATTHAVILGFMLYTEWTTFTAIKENVEHEAGALRNLFRIAHGLPAPAAAELDHEVRAYASAVINDDWPLLARGRTPELTHVINESMWSTLAGVTGGSAAQMVALDHAYSELSSMTQSRRTRLLQADTRLPGIFWCVLLVGGVLTVASVAMFGSRNARLHVFQVFSLTLLITLAILAIGDLDRPFRGWIHVDVYPFQRALDTMAAVP